MKRDARLRRLSSEHHHTLVLVRNLRKGLEPREVARIFEEQLAPHFAIEERVLLPALVAAGRADLAARTLDEHTDIRVARSDPALLADLLEKHVRFEERELFPACEELIPDALDRLSIGT
jgi:rRNA maturation protein Rpf1